MGIFTPFLHASSWDTIDKIDTIDSEVNELKYSAFKVQIYSGGKKQDSSEGLTDYFQQPANQHGICHCVGWCHLSL